MFTNKREVFESSWHQFQWKVVKNRRMILVLLAMQLFLLLIGSMSTYQMSTGTEFISVELAEYTILSGVMILSLVLFIMGITLGSKNELYHSTVIASTRTTHFLSDVLFIALISVITAALTFATCYLSMTLNLIGIGDDAVLYITNLFHLLDFLVIMSMYVFIASLGYLAASLKHTPWVIGILVLLVVFSLLFNFSLLSPIIAWIYGTSKIFVLGKTFLLAVVSFILTYLIVKKQEVND